MSEDGKTVSTETDIRDRLARAQDTGAKRSKLDELISRCQFGAAATVAAALGGELPRNQVIRADFTRGRP